MIVSCGTGLILAIGNLAGLGPAEWPSIGTLFSTSHRTQTLNRPCPAPSLLGGPACPRTEYSGGTRLATRYPPGTSRHQ